MVIRVTRAVMPMVMMMPTASMPTLLVLWILKVVVAQRYRRTEIHLRLYWDLCSWRTTLHCPFLGRLALRCLAARRACTLLLRLSSGVRIATARSARPALLLRSRQIASSRLLQTL